MKRARLTQTHTHWTLWWQPCRRQWCWMQSPGRPAPDRRLCPSPHWPPDWTGSSAACWTSPRSRTAAAGPASGGEGERGDCGTPPGQWQTRGNRMQGHLQKEGTCSPWGFPYPPFCEASTKSYPTPCPKKEWHLEGSQGKDCDLEQLCLMHFLRWCTESTQSSTHRGEEAKDDSNRGCTSGGVYAPGTYTHARWELL